MPPFPDAVARHRTNEAHAAGLTSFVIKARSIFFVPYTEVYFAMIEV